MVRSGFVAFATMVFGLAVGALAGQQVKPVYGPTNPAPEEQEAAKVKRFASVIELCPEREQEYRRLHASVWPKVVAAVKRANIRNYSIYVAELKGRKYLFSYLEYTGTDPKSDFAKIGEDPTIKNEWWPLTDACQRRLPGTPEGEQWKAMEMLMLIE
jgi:L-rhamnose mutarotase